MGVSLAKINSALRAWEGSAAGQSAIGAKIAQYRKDGTSTTQAGSRVLTAEEVSALANEFIGVLQKHAGSSSGNGGSGSMPASVSAHFSSLTAGAPVEIGDGAFSVTISFGDDLSRPSMIDQDDGHPLGGGVHNIVALFNNGVNAKGAVYGLWIGHEGQGPMWSRRSRPALGFMQAAKAEFEGAHSDINVAIKLGDDYA